MNQTLDDTVVRRDLPPILEVLRAASGLVVVAGLLLLVLAEPWGEASSRSHSSELSLHGESVGPSMPPRDNSVLYHPEDRLVLYYVVSSQDEAQTAIGLEAKATEEAMEVLARGDQPQHRIAKLLHARDNDEVAVAARIVFDELLDGGGAKIQVVDLRDVDAPSTVNDVMQGLAER
jgi:hypothetical protein